MYHIARRLPLLAAVAVFSLSSCSGSSTASMPQPMATPAPASTPAAPNSLVTLNVAIYIPNRTSSASAVRRGSSLRHPQYVPLSVNSIVFTATQSAGVSVSGTPLVVLVGSAACSASAGGQTCTAQLVGALGQDQWIVQTFASASGSGTALSRAVLVATLIAGQTNVSNLTLSPVLSGLAFVPGAASCNATIVCTQSIVLEPLDAAGATIVGPGSFTNAAGNLTPITLAGASTLTLQTSGGTGAATTLVVAGDGTLAKFAYDGTATMGVKSITASAGALFATFNLTLAADTLGTPPSVRIGNTDPPTTSIPVTEGGYVHPFTQTNNCGGVATIGLPSSNGPTATFPVTQLGGGTCSVLITDDHGGNSSVSVISTTYQVIIQ